MWLDFWRLVVSAHDVILKSFGLNALAARSIACGMGLQGHRSRARDGGGRTDPVSFEAREVHTSSSSGCALQGDERQMLPAFEVVDLQLELIAELAAELGVVRVARSGLEARLVARRRLRRVHLVRSASTQRRVGPRKRQLSRQKVAAGGRLAWGATLNIRANLVQYRVTSQ
jgi:hypothetical protein